MKTMTIKSILVFVVITLQVYSAFSQDTLLTKQWQEDLRYLQETVHSDFPFLFKKIKQEAWDAQVEELFNQIPNLSSSEVKVGLSRMVSAFAYGHTQIPFSTLAKEGVLPINLYHFKDGVYVEGAQKDYSKLVGTKVLKIGDFPIEEALKMIRPVVPVENDNYFKAYGLRFVTVPTVLHAQGVIPEYKKTIEITVEKDGKPKKFKLPIITYKELSRDYGFTIPNASWVSSREQSETPLYLKQLNEKYFLFEYLQESKTLYVRQSSVFDHETETLRDFYQRLFEFIDTHEVEKFIYDVRLNGGGNNYNSKPLIQGIMARPHINSEGKFFYIIGRNTFSACQNLTNEIETYTNAIIIGEPTSENKNFYGDTRRVTLPNSEINAYLSYAWWQDKAPWENGEATIPQFQRIMTFEEYRTNQDPILEMALQYDYEELIIDPMSHFVKLFSAGKMDQLRADATQIINDPLYAHIPFEAEFLKAGEHMLSIDQYGGAAMLFSLFTESYPNNPQFWEGLGTSLKGLGKEKEAEQAFLKAKELQNK